MKSTLSTLLLMLVFIPAAAFAESDVDRAEKQYSAALERAKKEFETNTKAAKDQLLYKLKSEMTALTKAGDLDGAIKIRDRMRALEAEASPDSLRDASSEQPKVAAPAPAPIISQAKPDTSIVKELKKCDVQECKVYAPDGKHFLVNKDDERGISQVYVGENGNPKRVCITNTLRPGIPKPDRMKMQAQWHPSGKWIFMAVEREEYSTPPILGLNRDFVEGELQCGIWTNMYAVSPDGLQWHRMTDFKSNVRGTADGFTGPAFTHDGKKAVWSQIVDGNIFVYTFGRWELIMADYVENNGVPQFVNLKNITPEGMHWNEPGNFHPDNESLLLSGSTEKAAEGQDQYILNIRTGKLTNLTHSPTVWDEHGVFSPDGEKIIFMSAHPYRDDPGSSKVLSIKTEFMLMNKDGSGLTQLTHFMEKESQDVRKGGIAACACWSADGRSATLQRLFFPKYEYWDLQFQGK